MERYFKFPIGMLVLLCCLANPLLAQEKTSTRAAAIPIHVKVVVAAMEDSGTLQALTFLDQAGRADLKRVLVLRTVSNYDREAPGLTPAESLKNMAGGRYSAYLPSLETAERVGDRVVRDIMEHWAEREPRIPRAAE